MRIGRRGLLTASLAVLPAGCAPVDVLNATIPTGGVSVTRDVRYGDGARHQLDIYRADKPALSDTAPPIVVFFYGGSWKTGQRGDYLFVGERLAHLGAIAVIPDYRIYPAVRFPAFVEDGAQAVAWVQRNASRIGGDPARIAVAGHSAGGHIAAMLALDPAYLAAAGGDRASLAGLIGLAGPYDFLPITDPDIIPIFAGSVPATTQPITYADAEAPPSMLLAGADDTTVNPANTRNLAAKLRSARVTVDERVYPDLGHIGLIIAFAPLFGGLAPVAGDVGGFVRDLPARATG